MGMLISRRHISFEKEEDVKEDVVDVVESEEYDEEDERKSKKDNDMKHSRRGRPKKYTDIYNK